MQRSRVGAFAAACVSVLAFVGLRCAAQLRTQAGSDTALSNAPPAAPLLKPSRSSPLDLEIGGEVVGLQPGETGYVTREALLALPQSSYRVSNDANFVLPTQVSGVPLEELAQRLGAAARSDLIVAMSSDKYDAYYPRAYIGAHHPLIALTINGQPPSGWPKDSEGYGLDLGPYLISHPNFTPSFKILSHADEPQIPWGVVRLEFRDTKTVFGAIAPRGPRADQQAVQDGYGIARQNCFRCHNMGNEGGKKAKLPWPVLASFASASPDGFAAYVRSPRATNARAQMPENPEYDDATLHALAVYFQTFAESTK